MQLWGKARIGESRSQGGFTRSIQKLQIERVLSALERQASERSLLAFRKGLFTVDDGSGRMDHRGDPQGVLNAFL